MKALVVGGAGFIGSHLCKELLEKEYEVICVDNLSLGKFDNIKDLNIYKSFLFFNLDATDKESMQELFQKYRPEIVYHLAANSDIKMSSTNPYIEYINTYTSTFIILDCMRKYSSKRLFFASTSAVYGDKRDVVLDENTPNLEPISYYGASKLGCEALIHAFSYMNDFNSVIFRFPNVIGPRLTHGVIFDFMNKLKLDHGKLLILGNGKQTKPYIYVTDLINAIMLLTQNIPQGVSIYNVSVEGTTSVTRIADIICEEMGLVDVTYEYTGGESGWKGDVPRFNYSIDKIKRSGWASKYSSDEAVRLTVRKRLEEESQND